ncbi:hypothetical protein G8A07_08385 [Roseateles sp. DAIF2]|uniref:hypothetical protein n=1 Tax=Roseateles sp. DAIF2 TaxID=2714952 RepID=UPI0018A2DBFB|nr:hypothetical protein [Roseateles sp. DAIF2]QPF72945.1 hypothetical protein G8A07_08385 [Roseateles sp. DAIF2]
MGADAFFAFYGVKFALDPEDEAGLDACGDESDPRCLAAKRCGLQTHSGRMTDGEDYFLYIGQRLGWLGLEHDAHAHIPSGLLAQTMAQVDAKLAQAGFGQPAALHLQLEAQY